jgi:hypothetical protein
MSTDSEQAQYASNPPQEPIDEMPSSSQQASRTAPAAAEQAPPRADAGNDNMAGGRQQVAASPQAQAQAPPAGNQQDTGGNQQDTSGRDDSGPATRQQSGPVAETSRQEASPASEDGSLEVNAGAGTDGTQHSLVADPSGYARRWESVQVGFVDDPRSAVQEAETLVSDVMKEMTLLFQRQQQQLEEQWAGGSQASTDDLRVAFQRYRDFFERLLRM